MSETKSNNRALSEDDVFSIELSQPGSSKDLQARIVAETVALPQLGLSSSGSSAESRGAASTMVPYAKTIMGSVAIAASLALAVIIWLPQGVQQDEPAATISAANLSLAELEFQDSILLQDELLFSSL